MPMLIEHIDAIARKKGRDVLYLNFFQDKDGDEDDFFPRELDWENLPVRKQIIAWLEENGIAWRFCAHFANENMMMGYRGDLYLDVPFVIENPIYQKLQNYLETPDGVIRFPGVRFLYLPLEMAMKNAHHDEPGFWERWAENF